MNDEEQKQMKKHNEDLEKLRLEKASKGKTHREKQQERKRH